MWSKLCCLLPTHPKTHPHPNLILVLIIIFIIILGLFRRAGLTARYISPDTECWDETQPVLMLRGEKNKTVNNKYRSWPKYRQGYDMKFEGSDTWNEKREIEESDEAFFAREDYAQMDKETKELVMGFVESLGGK